MRETQFLFQPRGEGTAYLFRMATPPILIGRPNPHAGVKSDRKPRLYGKEIRVSLGGTRDKKVAREERDRLLGAIREEARRAMSKADGSMEQALEIAETLNAIDDPEARDEAEHTVIIAAEDLEAKITKRLTPKVGRAQAAAEAEQKAVRWYKAATGKRTPLKAAYEQFKDDQGKSLSKSSLNNLATAVAEFLAFAGKDVCLQDVDRRNVAAFVTDFLPNRKGPKAPDGQGPATIGKKVSQLKQVWRWAQKRGVLPYAKETPWDEQAPSKRDIERAKQTRRDFTAEETRKLLAAAPVGDVVGDASRVALLCGVRLEEVAALDASQVAPDARSYTIREGKTAFAARLVPLVGMAREVIKARLTKVTGSGPLFPELRVRKSTGKRGGSISQRFTRLRRKVLGVETDGKVVLHSFRHTWGTAARRAGVDIRTTDELGGWTISRSNARSIYDHGLEAEQYERDQQRVADWFATNGYLG